MSQSKCLMCEQEVESYWHSMNVPGDYCTNCIDTVIDMHEFFERYNMELVATLISASEKGYNFDHKRAC